MKNKLTASLIAAAFAVGGLTMVGAQAATPLSEAACADFGCAASMDRSMETGFNAGDSVVSNVTIAPGTTLDVAVFAVTFGKTDSIFTQGPITSVTKVSDNVNVTAAQYGTKVTIPTFADAVGSQVIVAPADLTLENAATGRLPQFTGPDSKKVSTANMYSAQVSDTGINIGADFMTLYPSVDKFDVARINESGYNMFTTNLEFGIKGDVYNVQLLRDGKWVNVGVTGTSPTTGVSYDDSRTVHSGNLASVLWKLPTDITAGDYKVRAFNETKNVASKTERTVKVIGGTTATPTPSPSPSTDPTTEPTQTPTTTPDKPTGMPSSGN